MSRRSPSPEGVGDLLKQDSFGVFEDEEGVDHDVQMTTANDETGGLEDDDFNVTLDEQANGDVMKDSEPIDADSKQHARRQPIPHFPSSSLTKRMDTGNARYFIIKCNTHSNIDQSLKYGVWATQKHNEDKFAEAFKSGSAVYLIFSVNMSGHFQGYARMHGLPFKHKQGLWGGGAAVSNSFDVEWIRRYDLAFRDLEHIRNPLNEDKPIKISRDGQELPANLGQQVLQLFDQGAAMKGTADPPSADRNHDFNVGPAIGGYSSFRGPGMGRGGPRGPYPPRGPPPNGPSSDKQNQGVNMGMVMTPMGPMPAQIALGMMGGGMDFNPAMMNMGMSHGMMNMGMNGIDQMAAMQAMMGGRMPGMMGMPSGPSAGGPRGPVPPPKPPPPKSPPGENDYMKQMMENALKGMRASGSDRGRLREEDILLKAMEMSRRGGSPSRDRDRYRYRSRSRSPSPRRHRSHRRSRSRSRSRSTGRHRDKVADMSYEDYLEAYNALKRVRKDKETSLDFAGGMSNNMNPMMAQMAGMMGGSKSQRPANTPMGSQMPGMMGRQAGGGAGGGVGNMSEEEYVRVWETYSKSMGTPFDPNTVRGWYRQHKQTSALKK